jgi:hypothetical protein
VHRVLFPAIAFAIVTSAYSADWPQWRGPNRDGKSTETGLLKSWPEEGPELFWSTNGIGKGWSSPSIAGDSIYGVVGVKSLRSDI